MLYQMALMARIGLWSSPDVRSWTSAGETDAGFETNADVDFSQPIINASARITDVPTVILARRVVGAWTMSNATGMNIRGI